MLRLNADQRRALTALRSPLVAGVVALAVITLLSVPTGLGEVVVGFGAGLAVMRAAAAFPGQEALVDLREPSQSPATGLGVVGIGLVAAAAAIGVVLGNRVHAGIQVGSFGTAMASGALVGLAFWEVCRLRSGSGYGRGSAR